MKTLEELREILKTLTEERSSIMGRVDGAADSAALDALEVELRKVDMKIKDTEADITASEARATSQDPDGRTAAVTGGGVVVPAVVQANARGSQTGTGEMEARIEKLAADLRSGRSVTIGSDVQTYLEKRAVTTASVLIETKYKREIADNFNEVAQTVDLVDSFPLDGGKSYEVAFQITDGDADYTAEGNTYENDEGTFGTAATGYAKITNSAVVNEEVVELPNADYLTRIVNSVTKSIRKKMSHQIISGLGGANQLKGIYNAPAGTIPTTYKVELNSIDSDSLRDIVFSYGGDEDVESPATLFLSKLDLAAFAAVKATDGRPYYQVTYNGASGTIQEGEGGLRVPYTVNSACNTLSASGTVAGTKSMIYGPPMNYELPLFSPLVIKRSDERYIDQGKVGFFGHVIVGGVVNKYKGFVPVVKKA